MKPLNSTRMTATENLSTECMVGREPGYEGMHTRCRQTRDIPVHHSAPRILLQRRCRCTCHQGEQ